MSDNFYNPDETSEEYIERLERRLHKTEAKLDKISYKAPMCAACDSTYVANAGSHWRCMEEGCNYHTSKDLARIKRIPR